MPYSECPKNSTCSYVLEQVRAGEYLTIEVSAVNVAGGSTPWRWHKRWMVLPSGNLRLSYFEIGHEIGLV
eukprot:411688-Rhodomonas_salina.1